MNNYPNSRKNNIVVKEVDNEILIYDTETKKAFCLNETSALVWKFCDGKTNRSEIGRMAANKLGHKVDDAIVWLALEELRKDGLLSEEMETHTHYNGLTRRQVLRSIGITSAVSLPIVTSLVAPRASYAQSCVGVGTNPPGQLLVDIDCPFPGPPCSCASFFTSCCSGSASVDSCTTMAPSAGVPPGMQRCLCRCD